MWPFGAFVYSIINFRKDISKTIYILFHIYIGYCFFLSDNFEGADSVRYAYNFVNISNESWNYLPTIFSDYFKGEITDIYFKLTSFFISRFTSDPHIVFSFWGLVYGFFSMKCLNFCIDQFKYHKVNGYFIILLFAIFSLVHWAGINGLRFATGVYVFVYSVIQIIYFKKYSFLLLSIFAATIHFMYWLGIVIILLSLLLRKNLLIAIIIFILSFFYANVFQGLITKDVIPLNYAISKKIELYTDENYNFEQAEKNKQLIQIFFLRDISKNIYFYIIMTFLIYYIIKHKNYLNSRLISFFIFILILSSLANLFKGNFHAQFRFEFIRSFSIYIFIVLISVHFLEFRKQKIINIFGVISIIPTLTYFIIMLRVSFELIDASAFISNFPISIFTKTNVSFLDLIR